MSDGGDRALHRAAAGRQGARPTLQQRSDGFQSLRSDMLMACQVDFRVSDGESLISVPAVQPSRRFRGCLT